MVVRAFNHVLRMALAFAFMLAGVFLIVCAFRAWDTLYVMLEEEGTESISAFPFAEFGCVTFLMSLAFGGTLLCCSSVYFFRMKID